MPQDSFETPSRIWSDSVLSSFLFQLLSVEYLERCGVPPLMSTRVVSMTQGIPAKGIS